MTPTSTPRPLLSRLLSALLGAGLGCALVACSGSDSSDASNQPVKDAVPASTLADSWMVKVSAPGELDKLLGNAGWQAYYDRDYTGALQSFGTTGGPAARMHVEASVLYRQALLLQANAIVETYRADQRREGDPDAVDYPLGLAWHVKGDVEQGNAALAAGAGSTDAVVAAAAARWIEQLSGAESPGAAMLMVAPSAETFALGEVTPGSFPTVQVGPHFEVAEAIGEMKLKLSDPSALLQAAIWHESAARSAGGDALVDQLLAPWRLPFEVANDVADDPVPLEGLFLSSWSSEADLRFASALHAGAQPPADTVAAFADTSAYAAAIQGCLVEQAVDPECLSAAAVDVGRQVERAMETAAGAQSPDHRIFSDFVRAGVLRAGARAADALGQRETAGLLRINARDRSIGAAADPIFFLSLAAWDASQRNAPRAQELLHPQVDRVPGLQAARFSLDALHLRVSRDAGPALPMH